jgi:hypothetical protein
MKEFPSQLCSGNKKKFKELYRKRLLCYFRREIYEHVIKSEETDYFSLDRFSGKMETTLQIVQELCQNIIVPELEKLGWKCKMGFGNTGLFIYSTEKPPKNCWEGSL